MAGHQTWMAPAKRCTRVAVECRVGAVQPSSRLTPSPSARTAPLDVVRVQPPLPCHSVRAGSVDSPFENPRRPPGQRNSPCSPVARGSTGTGQRRPTSSMRRCSSCTGKARSRKRSPSPSPTSSPPSPPSNRHTHAERFDIRQGTLRHGGEGTAPATRSRSRFGGRSAQSSHRPGR